MEPDPDMNRPQPPIQDAAVSPMTPDVNTSTSPGNGFDAGNGAPNGAPNGAGAGTTDGGAEPGSGLTVIRREVPAGGGCHCESTESRGGLEWLFALCLLAGWRRRITTAVSVLD
jgi:hypothetical protein